MNSQATAQTPKLDIGLDIHKKFGKFTLGAGQWLFPFQGDTDRSWKLVS